jgi:hypothetical protein
MSSGRSLLAYHDRGDFSRIGRRVRVQRRCLGAPACEAGQPPCRSLARADRTPLRDARGAARGAARHGAAAPDDGDEAFWRLADRGYARFLEAFDWVLAYRQVLPEWEQTIAVSKTVQTVLKTRGLSRSTDAGPQAELAALEPLAAPVADFRTRLLEHVDREAAKLPAGANWLASSDIIESVFGHYKTFTARGPLKEVGRLVLLIPAFLSELSAPVIREAMTSVRGIDVEQWVEQPIGRPCSHDGGAPSERHQNCMN